jgi:predicted ATPase
MSMPGGAHWVELADVRDPVAVTDSIFKSLTVGADVFGEPPTQLADSACLVVIDNCEHVVDAAADAVRALLEATARVRVLATTREALSLRSESLYAVEPLRLPRLGATRPAEVIAAPAVSLFLDRARAARPSIVLGNAELEVVLEIARVLDGVPLAIELAAAGLASCGLGDLARQLTVGVGILVDHRRDVDRRHASIQAALDWTHRGAGEEEQVMFRRLATFARFRADDAVAVAGRPEDRPRTLAVLQSLLSKSLLVMEDRDGQGSYRLLQPVRLYARDRLREANEIDEFEDRHARHTRDNAMAARRRYFSDQPSVVAKLSFASGDIDLALRRFLDTAQYSEAVDLIRALALYWFFNDQRTGRRWADRASAELSQLDARQQVSLRFARGLLHHGGIELARSVDDLWAAVEGYQHLGRRRAEAASRFWLARAQYFAGRPATDYVPMFEAAAALADDTGDPLLVAWCQLWLTEIEWAYGVPHDIAERLTSVIEQAQRSGLRHPIGHACARLGQYALLQGDHATAKRYCDQAVAIYRDLDDRWHLAEQLDTRAQIALAANDLLSAALDVAEATALSLEIGEERGIARAASVLGSYATAAGHVDIARQLGAAYHAFSDRLTDRGGWSYPTPRPDLASILAAPSIDEACRLAQAELFP